MKIRAHVESPRRPSRTADLLVSLAFLLFYNLPLWQRLLAITPAGWQGLGMMLAVGLMIAAIFNLALTCWRSAGCSSRR